MMRKLLTLLCLILTLNVNAQSSAQARKVLDKTAAIVGRQGGCSAHFSMNSGKGGAIAGTIAVKGRKFHVSTPNAKIWYDGKTQWSYMKSTEEVNISTPTATQQMQMNPYGFITMYKSGYNMSMKRNGKSYVVTLKAQKRAQAIQTLTITIGENYVPSKVRFCQGGTWTTVTLTRFQRKNQSDAVFRFNKKQYPRAEIIDLR